MTYRCGAVAEKPRGPDCATEVGPDIAAAAAQPTGRMSRIRRLIACVVFWMCAPAWALLPTVDTYGPWNTYNWDSSQFGARPPWWMGMVTASMRSVMVSWTDKDVRVRVVFDRAISSEEIELVSEIESEVISHLPEHTVHCQAEASSISAKVQINADEVLVFQRASAA